jgi:hypothetical protein
VRLRAFGAGVVPLVLLLAVAPTRGQTPPPPQGSPQALPSYTGFVSSYEIVRRIRTAGFDPLAPPLREGTTYVLRATDYRGILMRVVVDARTGAIRDVTRIVPGPGRYGQFYGVPPYDPANFDGIVRVPSDADLEPPLVRPSPPVAGRPGPRQTVVPPPLPRPRPAALASRKPDDDTRPSAKSQPAAEPKNGMNDGAIAPVIAKPEGAKPDTSPAAKPEINSEVITIAPPPAPAASKKAPADVAPLND